MAEVAAEVIERLEAMIGTDRDPRGRAFAPIAELLRGEGRLVEARVRVEGGTEADPDFASGHMVAARVYADLGLDELARSAVDRVLQLDPKNGEAAALGIALESADEASALEWAKAQGDAPVAEPAEGEVLTMTMGDLYLAQGAPDRAVTLFERLVADDPDNEVLRSRLDKARSVLEAGAGTTVAQPEPALEEEGPEPMSVDDLAAPVSTVQGPVPADGRLDDVEQSDPVAVEALAPSDLREGLSDASPVAVADLGPDPVPVQELAPPVVAVESLAPDRSGGDEPDSDVDNFMAWLDDQ